MNDNLPPSESCDHQCPKLNWVYRLLVVAQFIIAAQIILTTSNSPFRSAAPASITVSGLAIGIWSIIAMGSSMNVSPRLKTNAQLKTDGPYRFVRHPMYLGLLLFCAGFVVAGNASLGWASLGGLAVVLGIKTHYEEQQLRSRFQDYQSYAQRTKRIVPFLF